MRISDWSSDVCSSDLRVNLRTEDDNDAFSFGDRAIRIAAAGRIGDFDLFGAYAFRERGNYFSGTTAPDYYQQEDLPANLSDNYVRRLGLNYEPGNEIPNTSSELESFLLKGRSEEHTSELQSLMRISY